MTDFKAFLREHAMPGIPTIAAIILTGISLLFANLAWAEDEPGTPLPVPSEQADGGGPIRLLSGNEPSYFAIAQDSDDTKAHIEFYLSVKYPLFTTLIGRWLGESSNLYFNYNGKYDLYVFSRDSSPIISRRQNSGLMYEYSRPAANRIHLQSLKTGYFHESNGQTVDTRTEYLATENARDYASRGWDYIPLEMKLAVSEKRHGIFGSFYLNLQGRYFLDKQLFSHDREDRIFWETAGEQPRIEDYDGIRAILSTAFLLPYLEAREIKFNAILRSGSRDFNLSQRYEATFRAYDLPIYLYYFRGYGVELATYNEKGTTAGIGLEFW